MDCPHLRDPTFCFHFEDAGVVCQCECFAASGEDSEGLIKSVWEVAIVVD